MARDVVRLIQDLRKQRDCQFTDRIIIHLDCQDSELTAALLENKDYIVGETLAVEFRQDSAPPAMECQTFEVAGHSISLGIEVV